MFIHKITKQRINPYAPVEIDGVRYHRYPLELLQEIPDPTPPEDYNDETYYRTESNEEPYVVYTKKSNKQLKQVRNAKRKARIEELESKQARAIREAVLTGDKTRLQKIEDDIAAERSSLEDAETE